MFKAKQEPCANIKINNKNYPVCSVLEAVQVYRILFPDEIDKTYSLYTRALMRLKKAEPVVKNRFAFLKSTPKDNTARMKTIHDVAKAIMGKGKKVSVYVSYGSIVIPKGFVMKINGKSYSIKGIKNARRVFVLHTGYPKTPKYIDDIITILQILGNKIEIFWNQDGIAYQISV